MSMWAQSRRWIMDPAIFADVDLWVPRVTLFFATAMFFWEGHSNASNRADFDAILSAMKIYTTLKKISTKTVYYKKSWSILKSVNHKI